MPGCDQWRLRDPGRRAAGARGGLPGPVLGRLRPRRAPRWACEGSTRDETGPATFVPADPTAVRVCLRTGMSGTSTDLDVGAASRIIAALRALPATRGPAPVRADRQAGRPTGPRGAADLRGPGPARTLQINLGCRPAVVGGTIVAPDADAVVAAITAATGYTLPRGDPAQPTLPRVTLPNGPLPSGPSGGGRSVVRAGRVADGLDIVAIGVADRERRSSRGGTPATPEARAGSRPPSSTAWACQARTASTSGAVKAMWTSRLGPSATGPVEIQKTGWSAIADGFHRSP